MMKSISPELISKLLDKASQSSRKRSHHNFHEVPEAPVQRLCIGLVKGTYVKPHLHPQGNKWEMIMALEGEIKLIIFSDSGEVINVFVLEAHKVKGVEVPSKCWHTILPLSDKAVAFEFKEGPYNPADPAIFAEWAPDEGSPDCQSFLSWAEGCKVGDSYPN